MTQFAVIRLDEWKLWTSFSQLQYVLHKGPKVDSSDISLVNDPMGRDSRLRRKSITYLLTSANNTFSIGFFVNQKLQLKLLGSGDRHCWIDFDASNDCQINFNLNDIYRQQYYVSQDLFNEENCGQNSLLLLEIIYVALN